MDAFEELIKDLGKTVDLPLHLDKNRACRLNINGQLHVQIESDITQERVLIAAFLCDIPAGKFRENVLREALKANFPLNRIGTLSYCERNNKLTLFEYLPMQNLNAQKLADYLAKFLEKADSWRVAIEGGQPSPEPTKETPTKGSIFDSKL